MSRGAEESLMALLEAMLTLAAQDVGIRRQKTTIKPGGHQEDIFVDLTEEEKDEFSCSICYQVLKETMQCVNRHKFCYSCLYVWSTTGQYANRDCCPVCRTHGYYFRDEELDERIGGKKVRCPLESCKWSGPLCHLQVHKHTTYGSHPSGTAAESDEEEEEERSNVLELPYLGRAPPRLPPRSQSRFMGTGLRAQRVMAPAAVATITGEEDDSNGNPVVHTTTTRINSSSGGGGGILLRERRMNNNTNSEAAISSGSSSPTRLTVRQRVHPIRRSNASRITITHTDNNNNQATGAGAMTNTGGRGAAATADSAATPRTPRPPSAPRPANQTVRRNLPGLSHRTAPRLPSGNNSLSSPSPAPSTFNAASVGRTNALGENLTEIRDRLQESRSRLDTLMTTFNGELERSRQEMAEFQVERERQRQEQLNEVRELGRRLGQVASELRRLLDHRRPFRPSDN